MNQPKAEKGMDMPAVLSAIYKGQRISVTKEDYVRSIRNNLLSQAKIWLDEKQLLMSQIAMNEVERLDREFEVFGYEPFYENDRERLVTIVKHCNPLASLRVLTRQLPADITTAEFVSLLADAIDESETQEKTASPSGDPLDPPLPQ